MQIREMSKNDMYQNKRNQNFMIFIYFYLFYHNSKCILEEKLFKIYIFENT